MGSRAASRTCLLAGAALALAACAPDDGRVPVVDLAARLPAAAMAAETRAVDFGSPAGRRHLRAGFSRGEVDRRGRPFAWGLGPASRVDFELLEPRDLELVLEGRPFRVPGAPAQTVAVAVNGEAVGEVTLAPRLESYRLRLPAERLAGGTNALELRYGVHASPRELGRSDDRRRLAVAWYGIRFGAGLETPAPRAEPGPPPVLALPFGTRLDYYLEPAPGSELRLERWAFAGAGRLEVELEAEGAGAVRLATLEEGGSSAAFPLPVDEGRAARLTLRALPAAEGGEVELAGAAVWAPAPDPPAVASVARPAPPPARPNVVLYLIDTLRADRLGCYGYGRPTSPEIDAFAERAVLFERVVAASSWTRASVASIFTGRWPAAHGANRRPDRLAAAAETLPERLAAAGYRTAAFVTNPNVTPAFGFGQGFDEFAFLGVEARSDAVGRAVAEWLDARGGDGAPFFLYVHTLDPHAPYDPPEPFRRRLAPGVDGATAARSLELVRDLQAGRRTASDALAAELEALYDAEVAAADAGFGALLDELEARGLYEGALVVLVSDHGEEFFEHGNWQHGRALHAESVDVPLIVKPPGWRGGRRIAERVRHVDLLPTVLDLAGLPAEGAGEGASLARLLAFPAPDGAGPAGGRAFSYLHLDGPARASVEDGGWKLILRLDHGEPAWPRLYRRDSDPRETEDLAGRFPIRAGVLAALVRERLAREDRLEAEEAQLDGALREGLEALGYLD